MSTYPKRFRETKCNEAPCISDYEARVAGALRRQRQQRVDEATMMASQKTMLTESEQWCREREREKKGLGYPHITGFVENTLNLDLRGKFFKLKN